MDYLGYFNPFKNGYFSHKTILNKPNHTYKPINPVVNNCFMVEDDAIFIVSNGVNYKWPSMPPTDGQVLTARIVDDDVVLIWSNKKSKCD